MPIGASDIPELRLVRLQRLVSRFQTPPNLVLMNLFGSTKAESDSIMWESVTGTRGMTPFVAPTAPAPQLAPVGVASHAATAAFWKEKMYLNETFLNNLRQAGTLTAYETAKTKLARELAFMRSRSDRRKEWMYAQMLSSGTISYVSDKGVKFTVNYDIPTANQITLAADRYWDTGANRNILQDIMDTKLLIKNAFGGVIDYMLFPTEILNMMIMDQGIQTLMSKSNFGTGNLFANPTAVLGSLLDIKNMVIYDEQFQLTAWLTAAVTGSSTTTVYVDDPTDFEVGGTLRFHDISEDSYEDETISAVSQSAGTITVSSAPTASFKAGEDKVTMTKKFLPTNKVVMLCSSIEGQQIAEFIEAPFGNDRVWGMKTDQDYNWDPEGVWIRTQNKGIPVLYQRDGVITLTVT